MSSRSAFEPNVDQSLKPGLDIVGSSHGPSAGLKRQWLALTIGWGSGQGLHHSLFHLHSALTHSLLASGVAVRIPGWSSRQQIEIARMRVVMRCGLDTLWLLRPCDDGGTDYVCFRDCRDRVEVLEGYHLPPQMPLIKHRQFLLSTEVPGFRHRCERQQGFRHGPPLF